MDPKQINGIDILKKIIENDGDCLCLDEVFGIATDELCEMCPFAGLKINDNGSAMSCVEAVIGINCLISMSYGDMNLKFKAVAEQMLLDHTVDNILREEDVTK